MANDMKNAMSQLKAILNMHPNLMDVLFMLYVILLFARRRKHKKQKIEAIKGASMEELYETILSTINSSGDDDGTVDDEEWAQDPYLFPVVRTDTSVYLSPVELGLTVEPYTNVIPNDDIDFVNRNFEGDDAIAAMHLLGDDDPKGLGKHDPMTRV